MNLFCNECQAVVDESDCEECDDRHDCSGWRRVLRSRKSRARQTMRKERGIAMAGPMVLKTLSGDKTETRRVVGDKLVNRYGEVGDWLYVREKAAPIIKSASTQSGSPDRVIVKYLADNFRSGWVDYPDRLKPVVLYNCWGRGCYKEAARIWLEIMERYTEGLQGMTHEDAIAEGFDSLSAFFSYWDILNKKRGYGWKKNPPVWVVKWDILSTTGRPV